MGNMEEFKARKVVLGIVDMRMKGIMANCLIYVLQGVPGC